ncbi:hypothetical protein EVAR_294_1 [Eumeta japonica]|uniref:Uncharacterized protein n=1 Tax=Eumeta variegata TaxID=151549 RepID=A0A4C1SCN5_EUMVA|nr:hypothetical protein EVAR_294_1 [Eumeta japonica]
MRARCARCGSLPAAAPIGIVAGHEYFTEMTRYRPVRRPRPAPARPHKLRARYATVSARRPPALIDRSAYAVHAITSAVSVARQRGPRAAMADSARRWPADSGRLRRFTYSLRYISPLRIVCSSER